MSRIIQLSVALFVLASTQRSMSQAAEQLATQKHSLAANKADSATGKPGSKTQHSALSVVETIKLTGIDTGLLVDVPQCDADGNLYLRNDIDFQSPIHKLSLKGEKKADFLASSSSDLPQLPPQLAHSGAFWVSEDGELYLEIMASMTEHDLLVFGKDGTYKSKVGIDNGSLWHLKKFAVFPSRDFLIAGEKWQKPEQNYAPFTAIFSSRGTFLKELSLDDDAKIYQYTVAADSEFVPHPGNNRAIFWGAIARAPDGNIYLMRWLSPAVIYAISAGGEVLRRFTVNPGDARSMPSSMRIAGDSIAIEFRNKDTKKQLFKVVDLEGRDRAIYEWPEFEGKPLWLSLCYFQNPVRFVFLDQAKDDIPVLRVAEPH
jgi:hypothetical protein